MIRRLSAAALVLLLGACAGNGEPRHEPAASDEPLVVGYEEPSDPLSGLNRAVFGFNDVAYRWVLVPAARGYLWLPTPVRDSVGNLFDNLRSPVSAVNHLLQLDPVGSGRNLLRFTINSTLGLAGLFDPADAWFGIEQDATGFADTLGRYGAGHGAYLVLPIFGASDFRSAPGLIVDALLHPLPWLIGEPESTLLRGVDSFQQLAPEADNYVDLHQQSDDPYVYFRDLHLQGVQRDVDFPAEPDGDD